MVLSDRMTSVVASVFLPSQYPLRFSFQILISLHRSRKLWTQLSKIVQLMSDDHCIRFVQQEEIFNKNKMNSLVLVETNCVETQYKHGHIRGIFVSCCSLDQGTTAEE